MSELQFLSEHRPLGESGIMVSPLAWGMWRFKGNDIAASTRLVNAALDAGITLFDTADIYGPDNEEPFGASEALLGRVFAANPSLRDRMVLASKGGIRMGVPYDSSASYIVAAVEASLKRLGTDRLDLWQIHRPDMLTHPQEVAHALDCLVASGKVRAVGVSNFTPAQIRALEAYLTVPLVSHQPEFSALHYKPLFDGTLDLAMERNHAVLAWSPLGQGRLGGDPLDPHVRDVAIRMDMIAERHNVGRSAVAYAWIGAHPARPIPIVGTQNPARVAEAAGAHGVTFTREEWYGILQAAMGQHLP